MNDEEKMDRKREDGLQQLQKYLDPTEGQCWSTHLMNRCKKFLMDMMQMLPTTRGKEINHSNASLLRCTILPSGSLARSSHCSLSYPIRSCFFVPSVPSYVSSLLVLLRNLIKSEQMDKMMASQICTDGAIATAWLYVQSLLKMLLNENYAAFHEYVLEVRMHYYMMFCNVYAIA